MISQDDLKNLIEERSEDFNYEEVASNMADIVRWAIMREDYKDAAKHAYVLGMLGIELEDLELDSATLNKLVPHFMR